MCFRSKELNGTSNRLTRRKRKRAEKGVREKGKGMQEETREEEETRRGRGREESEGGLFIKICSLPLSSVTAASMCFFPLR